MRRKTFAQQADVSQNTDYSTIISFPARGYNCMVNLIEGTMNKIPSPSWLRILSSSWLTNSIAVIATIYACLTLCLPTQATTVLGPPCGTASQCAATSSSCPAGEGWIFLGYVLVVIAIITIAPISFVVKTMTIQQALNKQCKTNYSILQVAVAGDNLSRICRMENQTITIK
jgi:hypothetical protein